MLILSPSGSRVDIQLRRVPTDEEVELICTAAEEAAREFILSKISLKKLDDLDLSVEGVGDKPLSVTVQIAIESELEDPELGIIIDNATDAAFAAAEAKVRELNLCDASSD
jgi:hypothetical protein